MLISNGGSSSSSAIASSVTIASTLQRQHPPPPHPLLVMVADVVLFAIAELIANKTRGALMKKCNVPGRTPLRQNARKAKIAEADGGGVRIDEDVLRLQVPRE
jgi:hypothetical protein